MCESARGGETFHAVLGEVFFFLDVSQTIFENVSKMESVNGRGNCFKVLLGDKRAYFEVFLHGVISKYRG